MRKIFCNQFARLSLLTCILVFGSLAVVAPVSCRLTDEGLEIVPADTIAPTVEEFSVAGANLIHLSCSEKFILDKISVFELDSESDEPDDYSFGDEDSSFAEANVISYSEDQKSADIELSNSTVVGKMYVLLGVVYDSTGNSLEFSQKFVGYNENPARLIFNEVRTQYSKSSKDVSKSTVEFIEFYVLKGGNLFGLEFVSGNYGVKRNYKFPAIDVRAGEYITVHLRTFEEFDGIAVDELGDDLSLSKAADSCDTARDLWRQGIEKCVNNFDVLVLRDGESGELKDALFLCESKNTDWKNALEKEFAKRAYELGIWTTGETVDCAVVTDGMGTSSKSRTVSRQNTSELAKKYASAAGIPEYIGSSAADFIVTDSQTVDSVSVAGATPGFANSSNPYSSSEKKS